MLTVTPQANAALVALLESPEVPDGTGIRLAPGTGPDGELGIGLALAPEPEETDEVVDTVAGVEIWVAPEAADVLDDQELDVIEAPDGRVAFTLHPQTWNGSASMGPDGL
jgi:iron-sulfur cluster assembly protein